MANNDIENNKQEDRWPDSTWIEERMSALDPGADWSPDAVSRLAQLRDRRSRGSGKLRRPAVVMAMVAITGLGLMAFPSSRAFAQRSTHALAQHPMHPSSPGFSPAPIIQFHN